MKNPTDQEPDDLTVEDSQSATTLRKIRYTQVFAGDNWIPCRMGEQIFRSEIESDLVFLSPNNDANATQRLVKSYTHRLGVRASLKQCRVLYEDDKGNDIVRRGVVCHIESHTVAEKYKADMEIAAIDAKRQASVDTLYRLMSEVGLSPESFDFNQPFTDKDGIEHYPQDFIMISEDSPEVRAEVFADFPAKRKRGRPKKV